MVPCNYIHKEFNDVGDSVYEGCIADRQKQMDYLGNIKAVWFFNEESFNPSGWGGDTIERKSRFESQQID